MEKKQLAPELAKRGPETGRAGVSVVHPWSPLFRGTHRRVSAEEHPPRRAQSRHRYHRRSFSPLAAGPVADVFSSGPSSNCLTARYRSPRYGLSHLIHEGRPTNLERDVVQTSHHEGPHQGRLITMDRLWPFLTEASTPLPPPCSGNRATVGRDCVSA